MSSKSLLELRQVSLHYGGIQALHNVQLHVDEGEIVSLIGANGAGKTSCLRAISGLLRPQSGQIFWSGSDITGQDPAKLVRRGLAHSPEGRMVLARQTVEDNLKLGGWTRRDQHSFRSSLEAMYEFFPRLKERRQQLAGTLSGGEQQMLAIARALMARPRLLLLDEPSLGLAPLIVKEIFERISLLNSQGLAVLLVEQNAQMALRFAHRAYGLETGSIVFEGEAAALLHDPRVQAAYLGS